MPVSDQPVSSVSQVTVPLAAIALMLLPAGQVPVTRACTCAVLTSALAVPVTRACTWALLMSADPTEPLAMLALVITFALTVAASVAIPAACACGVIRMLVVGESVVKAPVEAPGRTPICRGKSALVIAAPKPRTRSDVENCRLDPSTGCPIPGRGRSRGCAATARGLQPGVPLALAQAL